MEYRPAWYEAHFERHKAIFKRKCEEPVRIDWQTIRNCTRDRCAFQGHNKIRTYTDLAKFWRVPTREEYQKQRIKELEKINAKLKARLERRAA